jgi:hypothetical protein
MHIPYDFRDTCRIWSSRSGGYEEFCPLGYNAVSEEHVASILIVEE